MPLKTSKKLKRIVSLFAIVLVFSTLLSSSAIALYQYPLTSVLFHWSKQISNGYPRIKVYGRNSSGEETTRTIANMNGLTGHSLSVNGEYRPVYCLNPNQEADSNYVEGPSYKAARWAKLTVDQQDLVLRALYCGYPNITDDNVEDIAGEHPLTASQAQHLALQAMIFNIRCNFVVKDGTGVEKSTSFNDTDSFDERVSSDYTNFHTAYSNLYDRMNSFSPSVGIPSFATLSTETADAYKTIKLELDASTGNYTATVTDANGVLGYYDFTAINGNGVAYTVTGNTLTITATPEAASGFASATRTNDVASSAPDVTLSVDDVTFYVKSGQGTDNYQTLAEYVSSSTSLSYKKVYLMLEAEANGLIKVVKGSAMPDVTSGNSAFSLEGAVFSIYTTRIDAEALRNAVGTITTDANGEGTSEPLASSVYYVRETTAPPGYELSDEIQTVSVPGGETFTLSVDDMPICGILEVMKKDKYEEIYLSGAGFRVYDSEGHQVAEGYTDTNGKLKVKDLPYGEYTYQEFKAPKGFKLDETVYSFSITEDGATVTHTRVNERRPGTIEVKKQDADGNPFAGVVFLLEYSTDNGSTWLPVFSRAADEKNITRGGCTSPGLTDGQLVTDDTGKVRFTGLRADSKILYRLTETAAPEGYALMAGSLYVGTLPVESTNIYASDAEVFGNKAFVYSLYVTATDDPVFRLPETGGSGFGFLPLAMLLCAAPIPIITKKSKNKGDYIA